MNNSKKKKKIFDIYSQNLTWVKSNPKIRFEPDFEDSYLCPLCFDIFGRDSLLPSASNPLTLEHNPPESLGGKHKNILTCKECNSKAGHYIDSHLSKILNDKDFFDFKTNTSKDVTIVHEDNIVNGSFSIDSKGQYLIDIHRKRSNPNHADNLMSGLKSITPFATGASDNPYSCASNPAGKIDLKMRFRYSTKGKEAEIALLKIAYLKAFEVLGNGFLIHPSLSKVREQILNPQKQIIPRAFALDLKSPEKVLGVSIITEPKELRCFLVTFLLKTKVSQSIFAIALPGHSSPGLDIYKNLEAFNEKNTLFKAELLNDFEYLKDKDLAFASHNAWKILTGS